jgi:hypothetical protein
MNDFPYKFPNEADKVYYEAQEYRRMSDTERILRIFRLMEGGKKLMECSPKREFAKQWRDGQEAEWRRVQRELFARHGK